MADRSGPVAALSDVSVDYPGGPRLGPLNLAVAAHEIVALVGASGAGKSTTYRQAVEQVAETLAASMRSAAA